MRQLLHRALCTWPPQPLVVCVTGAAGQIAYSLLFALASGSVFGATQVRPVRLMRAHRHRDGHRPDREAASRPRAWTRHAPSR